MTKKRVDAAYRKEKCRRCGHQRVLHAGLRAFTEISNISNFPLKTDDVFDTFGPGRCMYSFGFSQCNCEGFVEKEQTKRDGINSTVLDKGKFEKQLAQLINHQQKILFMAEKYKLFLSRGGKIDSQELIELFDLILLHSKENGTILHELANQEGLFRP